MITPAQIRAARALLNISQQELANELGVSVITVKRLESERDVYVSLDAVEAAQKALEARGVKFLGQDGLRILWRARI